jgi:glycosyltransferase involved in cell wall biosynthesis
LASASLIITDSNELSQKLIAKYGVDIGRTIAMPYSPSDLRECVSSSMNDVLGSYQISEGYFFYPAQFWAHKNHARIINAIKILKAQGAKVKVVFAGGDKGNVSYIKALALEAEVLDQIHFLGFVPQEHMRGLYMGSLAVLMPTYFGPTNLPAFEAWTLDKPLIYSSHLSAHAGKAAIYSDPDNAEELALSMQKCEDAKIVEELIKQGQLRLQKFSSERSQAEAQLKAFIQKFSARRQCWR